MISLSKRLVLVMNNFWTIFTHTFWTRFKSKSFLITTAIMLLVLFAVSNIDKIIELFTGDEKTIVVIDETDTLFVSIEEGLEESLDNIVFKKTTDTLEEVKKAVQNGDIEAILHIEATDDGFPNVFYYTDKGSTSSAEMTIEQQLNQLKTMIATEEAGIDADVLASIYEPIAFEKVALAEGAKTEEELGQARGIVYVMLFVLYMAVIIYGQMIATDVALEKSSRVMEILISSAPPITHMFAKILGIALLGLTQMLIFFLFGFTMIKQKMEGLPEEFLEGFGLGDQSIGIYIYAIVFFVLGYLLYATIAAMLGSIVSRVEDVQQLVFPMMILIIIAFMIAMVGLGMPEAKFITITSFIPFFAPMIMFLRVGMLDVPIWEVALGITILVATIGVFAWFGARIYRGGVLLYGPSRSLKDFKQVLQMTKKEK